MRKVASLSVSEYNKITNAQDKLNRSTANYGNTLRNAIGGYLGMQGIRTLARWGTELKQTQIQFETLASSAQKGDDLYAQLKRYANITPYLNSQVNKAAVTMLSFGVAEDKIMPGIQTIGDIASGNAERFEALALAYAQSQAAGKMMGQELLQMVNAGFNPLQEISRKTGISMAVLRKQMENGAISSKMIEDAFRSATEEGGRFHGMMNRMTKEAFGVWSNITGQLQTGFGNLSSKMQDALIGNLKTIESISGKFLEWTERVNINAATVAKWVKIAYQGAKAMLIFKAATMGVNIWMKYLVPAYKAASYGLFAMRFQLKFATAETFALTNIARLAKIQWIGLSKAMKANAIGLAVTGLAMLVSWLGRARTAANEASEAQRSYNDQLTNTDEIARRRSVDEMLAKYGIISSNGIDVGVNLEGGAYAWMDKFDKMIAESGINALGSFQTMLQDQVVSTQRKLDQLGITGPDEKLMTLKLALDKVNAELEKYDKNTANAGSRGMNFNTVSETSNNIISGGSKPTNITINLQKLNEKIEVHAANLKESLTDIEGQFVDMFLRVLNSSAKISTQ